MAKASDQPFDDLCRTCMQKLVDASNKPQQWQYICDTIYDGDTLGIADLISNTVPQIKIPLNDELPKKICSSCLQQLVSVHRFQQTCIKSDKQLHELLAELKKMTKAPLEDEMGNKEFTVQHLLLETKDQIFDFEAQLSSATDPLQSNDEIMEQYKDSVSDASALVKNEPHNYDAPDVVYNDEETSHSRNTHKSEEITEGTRVKKVQQKKEKQKLTVAQPKEKLEYCKFKCDICNRYFHKAESLHNHRLVHDGKADINTESHDCDLCEKTYSSRRALARHRKVRHPTESSQRTLKQYSCEFCDKVFKSSGVLKKHNMRGHRSEGFLCPECGKSFSTERKLKEHSLRHSEEKPYECPHCPLRFSCPGNLSNHKEMHATKQHICHICGSAFKQRHRLEKHKKYHIGEKPYKCDYCEMCFVRPDHKRRHMRIHTGEKPYKCKYCDRAYSQSGDLIKHLRRSHLGDKVYRCELCPLAFRLASEMRAHFASHKNDDEETRERNMKALNKEEANLAKLSSDRLL